MPRGTHPLSLRAWRVPGWRAVASRRPAFVAEPRPGGRFAVPARAHRPTRRASRARRLEGATTPATHRACSRSRIGRRLSRATTPRASRRLETPPERRSRSRRTPARWTRSRGGSARLSGRRKRPPRPPRWPTSSRVTRAARNVSSSGVRPTRRRMRRASKSPAAARTPHRSSRKSPPGACRPPRDTHPRSRSPPATPRGVTSARPSDDVVAPSPLGSDAKSAPFRRRFSRVGIQSE